MATTAKSARPAAGVLKETATRIDTFIAKFDPAVARQIRSVRKALRKRFPGAVELVYDNYNFFVIGYAPNERASEVVLSLAAQAKGITLFFWHGVKLPDPHGLLSGSGKQVRSLQVADGSAIQQAAVEALIVAALALGKTPMPAEKGYAVVKAVSAKQRLRRTA